MKRRDFLKKFGIATAAIVVAPKIIGEVVKEKPEGKFLDMDDTPIDYTNIIAKGRMKGLSALNDHTAHNVLYTGEMGMKEFEKAIRTIYNA